MWSLTQPQHFEHGMIGLQNMSTATLTRIMHMLLYLTFVKLYLTNEELGAKMA